MSGDEGDGTGRDDANGESGGSEEDHGPGESEDPFEYLDDEAFDDRTADPFAGLDVGPDEGDTEVGGDSRGEGDAERGGSDRSGPDRSADPFAGEGGSEADGDPFAGGNGAESDAGPAAGEESSAAGGDPFVDAGADPAGGDAVDDPLAGVDVPTGDPFEDADLGGDANEFESTGVTDIDADAVWEQFADAQPRDARLDRGDETVEVSKHDFCETCPHFSGPPAVRCTHEGTEILEFVDMETVRVVDCPVIAERRELGGVE